MLCECCGENEVWPEAQEHGYNHCEACSSTDRCDGDDCNFMVDDEHLLWEIGLCERCQKTDRRNAWIADTLAEVERLAVANGWQYRLDKIAETLSHYVTLTRLCNDDDIEVVKVRVSDHGSAYCSEDYSIAMDPGGDDHSLETLERRLSVN